MYEHEMNSKTYFLLRYVFQVRYFIETKLIYPILFCGELSYDFSVELDNIIAHNLMSMKQVVNMKYICCHSAITTPFQLFLIYYV